MDSATRSPSPAKTKPVAVLIHGVGYYGGVVTGITEYAMLAKDWQFKFFPHTTAGLKAAGKWGARGLIARINTRAYGHAIMRTKLPVVSVSTDLEDVPYPIVGSDDVSVGRMAADFLLAGGFRHFAYFHLPDFWYSRQRYRGFQEHLAEHGFKDPVPCFAAKLPQASQLGLVRDAPTDPEPLAKWLRSLEKPVALFACYDDIGLFLVQLCYDLGLRVPEDVYVLGVDNVGGDMVYPPLPSVETSKREIGYRAAMMLDQLMDGRPIKNRTILIPPLRVVDRQSLRFKSMLGTQVWAAQQFIQYHVNEQISVAQVVEAAGVSRRTLERLFQSILGRTILDEVQRIHLDRARELLENTDWSAERIAVASGFHDGDHLRRVMRTSPVVVPSLRCRRPNSKVLRNRRATAENAADHG